MEELLSILEIQQLFFVFLLNQTEIEQFYSYIFLNSMQLPNPPDDGQQIRHKETLRNLYDCEESLSSIPPLRKNSQFVPKKSSQSQAPQNDYVRDLCKRNIRKTYINLFIRKLKQIIVRSNEMDHPLLEDERKEQMNFLQSTKLPINFQIILNCGIIIQFLLLFFYSTLALVFNEVNKSEIINKIALFCLCIQFIEIICKILFESDLKIKKRSSEMESLSIVLFEYFKSQFALDMCILIILMVDSIEMFEIVKYFRLIMLLKLPRAAEKIRILEIVLIQNCYKEQYWELAKLFIINFIFAHIIGVLLIMMASINENKNWLIKNSLNNLNWYQKYVWAYYWGTTIMLTVGFGDISASTTQQAGCMVLIETMSCILLTYNINSVGNIIRNIGSYETQKETNLKIFNRMQDRSSLSEEIKNKINNFIIESTEMKRNYNLEEEEKLIKNLPTSISEEYRKQSNFSLFLDLPFFRNLSEKYLAEIAIKIERKLTHPGQIILFQGKIPEIVIANNGVISMNMYRPGKKSHGKQIQTIKLSQTDFKLLSGYFILNKLLPYDIKCCEYSTVYKLEKETLESIIKDSPYNYQYFKMLKDKDHFNPSQFETFICDFCEKDRHTIANCPKFHFVPIHQFVIDKYLHKNKKTQSDYVSKKDFQNLKKRKKMSPLENYIVIEEEGIFYQENQKQSNAEKLKTTKSIAANLSRRYGHLNVLQMLDDNSEFQHFLEKENPKLGSVYEDITREIREEISKVPLLLNEQKVFEWDIESDVAFDFQYYFSVFNPLNVEEKYKNRKPAV